MNPKVDYVEGREKFLQNISHWDSHIFGNISMQKRRLYARLNDIQISLAFRNSNFLIDLEKTLLMDLNNIHQIERRI